MTKLTCFKAYDVRGRLGIDLDEDIAYRIARAFAQTLKARKVVLGRDCRASSDALADAATRGLVDAGADVLDLGLSGTEEMYFGVTHFEADGGITVTASHNPMDYNGMKMVKRGSAPLNPATEMKTVQDVAEAQSFETPPSLGQRMDAKHGRQAYVDRVLTFIDVEALRPLKILVNAGNGAAGPTFDALAEGLERSGAPLKFVRMHHEPDGSFPNGIPNPLLPENQPVTSDAVIAAGADLGVAWDGDFDRCFLFDHSGQFIPGEYIVGLLAEAFLAKEPGASIVYDPRVIWNTQDIIAQNGGHAVASRTGHAFLKQALRDHGAVYGGEMSAHHYFKDFVCCDSGMIPWLLIAELISRRDTSLADLIDQRRSAFPSSGEINFKIPNAKTVIKEIEARYADEAVSVDHLDGLSVAFETWRFNLRSSNTEPVVRLNVEARGDAAQVAARVAEISALLNA